MHNCFLVGKFSATPHFFSLFATVRQNGYLNLSVYSSSVLYRKRMQINKVNISVHGVCVCYSVGGVMKMNVFGIYEVGSLKNIRYDKSSS